MSKKKPINYDVQYIGITNTFAGIQAAEKRKADLEKKGYNLYRESKRLLIYRKPIK